MPLSICDDLDCNGNSCDIDICGWVSSSLDDYENGEFKRMKRTMIGSSPDTIGSHGRRPYSIDRTNLSKIRLREQIWTYNQMYRAAEAMEDVFGEKPEKDEAGDGMKLVQLLVSCAEAVACRDKSHASILLSELNAVASVFGTSFQRVASCFIRGLEDRLTSVQPLGSFGMVGIPTMNLMDIVVSDQQEEALSLVYEICPHIKFGHFVANSTILEAFEGESYLHVVDLGMTLGLSGGHQWKNLIQILGGRESHKRPIRLRITAVGLAVERFHTIGEELESYADGLGVNMEFTVVKSNLENLKPEAIMVKENEVVVVNSVLQLHCVVKESRGALNSVLQIVHGLAPKALILVEQDSSHNGPFFLGRFMEALHYYSAIFDSLDAMLPRYDTRRAKMEQFYFAEEIKNIVSCEGPGRVERHERLDQWRRRMSRAGFQPSPIKLLSQTKQWVGKMKACDGYTVVEEKGCLVLGWKSKPIVAASCWKC